MILSHVVGNVVSRKPDIDIPFDISVCQDYTKI